MCFYPLQRFILQFIQPYANQLSGESTYMDRIGSYSYFIICLDKVDPIPVSHLKWYCHSL